MNDSDEDVSGSAARSEQDDTDNGMTAGGGVEDNMISTSPDINAGDIQDRSVGTGSNDAFPESGGVDTDDTEFELTSDDYDDIEGEDNEDSDDEADGTDAMGTRVDSGDAPTRLGTADSMAGIGRMTDDNSSATDITNAAGTTQPRD